MHRDSFGDGYELDRAGSSRARVLLRMSAAHQLSAGLEIDQRLMVELELALGEGHSRREREGSPRLHPYVHGRLKKAVGAASVGLGPIPDRAF